MLLFKGELIVIICISVFGCRVELQEVMEEYKKGIGKFVGKVVCVEIICWEARHCILVVSNLCLEILLGRMWNFLH